MRKRITSEARARRRPRVEAGNAPDAGDTPAPAAFVDFGCGTGASFSIASHIARGSGFGIEPNLDKVAQGKAQGLDIRHGDLLTSDQKGIATSAFAVDVFPELANRAEFETATTNLIRSARDFAVIQHLCFDSAEALLSRGLMMSGANDKAIRIRPRAIDYLHLIQAIGASLDVVGLAIFGYGEARTVSSPMAGLRGSILEEARGRPAYRSLRVVIGRKAPARFEIAVARAGTGDLLLLWEPHAAPRE